MASSIIARRALFSRDGVHRLRLDRTIHIEGPYMPRRVVFIGVNPSVAGDENDDPTVRKLAGFCQRWRYSDFTVVNVFSRVATRVKDLAAPRLVALSPRAREHMIQALTEADLIIPMWGSRHKLPKALHADLDWTAALLRDQYRSKVEVFGITASGDPVHPLMLSYTTPLRPWGSP